MRRHCQHVQPWLSLEKKDVCSRRFNSRWRKAQSRTTLDPVPMFWPPDRQRTTRPARRWSKATRDTVGKGMNLLNNTTRNETRVLPIWKQTTCTKRPEDGGLKSTSHQEQTDSWVTCVCLLDDDYDRLCVEDVKVLSWGERNSKCSWTRWKREGAEDKNQGFIRMGLLRRHTYLGCSWYRKGGKRSGHVCCYVD
ncbi:hypothetical protein LX36DRAFT_108675 [Colletotrichum falcatum]|nr:hypothetical protein LX36DRAFT_108675 [Colletotrichum falcatum]